jgi:protein-S-isoprenylcysteine O-methyltransferase Ste14
MKCGSLSSAGSRVDNGSSPVSTTPARLVASVARRRVALGFLAGIVTLVLAQPTWTTWRAGLVVAMIGEAIRLWAAGHLEKSREVTRSGPYRWTSHPLYLGSSIMALGVVIASRSLIVAVVVIVYMAVTISSAIVTEERFLRRTFGTTYDEYKRAQAEPVARRFSLSRARRNREHRAIAGLAAGFGILALKIALSI